MSLKCGACGRTDVPLSTCKGCGNIKYCDGKCQKAHWRAHKSVCQGRKDYSAQSADAVTSKMQSMGIDSSTSQSAARSTAQPTFVSSNSTDVSSKRCLTCNNDRKCTCTTRATDKEAVSATEALVKQGAQLLMSTDGFVVQSYLQQDYPTIKSIIGRSGLTYKEIARPGCVIVFERSMQYILDGTLKGHRGALVSVWNSDITKLYMRGKEPRGFGVSFMSIHHIVEMTHKHAGVLANLMQFDPDRELMTMIMYKLKGKAEVSMMSFRF